eukprot:jgi/Botrbrau1/10861/Bobra.0025s0039.2
MKSQLVSNSFGSYKALHNHKCDFNQTHASRNADSTVQTAGFRYWPELPEPIQRLILRSPGWSLSALARLAPTCKMFLEAYHELAASEELWLVDSAVATFSQRVIDIVLHWVRPREGNSAAALEDMHRAFDMLEDNIQPADPRIDSMQRATLRTPSWGVLDGHKNPPIRWLVLQTTNGASIRMHSGEYRFVEISRWKGRRLEVWVKPVKQEEAASCIGLILLACRNAPADEGLLFKWPFVDNEEDSMEPEARRALTALQTWYCRNGRGRLEVDLNMWGKRKPANGEIRGDQEASQAAASHGAAEETVEAQAAAEDSVEEEEEEEEEVMEEEEQDEEVTEEQEMESEEGEEEEEAEAPRSRKRSRGA